MGLFKNQFLNVIEWNETRDDVLFWMWRNDEIKKNSRLIIRPGQDAIFLYNGVVEGVFKDEGNYEIETEIVPFLSTLKGFKFGFNSGIRAEVLFINTKEFMVRWGTKNPINIPAPGMPGGMPIRCFGSYAIKIDDYMTLIDKIAGVKQEFTIDDVKQRTMAIMDSLIMKSIVKEGKDMFNLQVSSHEIANGLKMDLDMELLKIGLTVTSLTIENFSYPEQVQKMINKNAAYGMVGNIGQYQNVAMVESMEKNPESSMAQMAQAGMGMKMGMQMMESMTQNMNQNNNQTMNQNINQVNTMNTASNNVNCNSCGASIDKNTKFCPNCGNKVELKVEASTAKKFCSECGTKVEGNSKFCMNCGAKF